MESKPWLDFYDPHVPKTIQYPGGDLYGLFEESARGNAQVNAVKFMGLGLTYGRLLESVEKFSAALAKKGVGKGDRVVLLMPNCPQFVISYYALMRLGAAAVLANPLNVERELSFKINDSGAKGIIALDLFSKKLNNIRTEVNLEFTIYTGMEDYLPFPKNLLFPLVRRLDGKMPKVEIISDGKTSRFRDLLAQGGAIPKRPPMDGEDLAALIYSGGTTGIAKGIMLSHRALIANLSQVISWVTLCERDVMLVVLPLFHGFGMSVCMNAPLSKGGTIILQPKFDAAKLARAIEKENTTLFAGVPTMFIALKSLPNLREINLKSLRGIFVGAAPMPLEVMREFEELTGAPLIEGYGLTEAVTAISCNPASGTRKPGTIGIPFPDVQWKIMDLEKGETELAAGEAGELIIKCPDLMTGYLNQPEKTAETIRNGWLYTGDIAVMDKDGYATIVDRKKDLVIVSGFNVFPSEIDEILYRHPKVLEAVAVGLPHPQKGEYIKAYVVPRPSMTITPGEILEHCRANLSAYMVPGEIEVRESLPKSMIGKILRSELREEEMGKGKAGGF